MHLLALQNVVDFKEFLYDNAIAGPINSLYIDDVIDSKRTFM